MKIGKSAVFEWGLMGFILGTILSTAYGCSGDSMFHATNRWAQMALFPGKWVGTMAFNLMGYSPALSLACLTVGVVYSAIASTIAGALWRMRMVKPGGLF